MYGTGYRREGDYRHWALKQAMSINRSALVFILTELLDKEKDHVRSNRNPELSALQGKIIEGKRLVSIFNRYVTRFDE